MRTLTIAHATWREAIRHPVAILILVIAAFGTFFSQFLNFYHFDEEAEFSVIRQMSVAQTLMCGIVIAVFAASAVLAEEIENRTVLTLLAKPVRRYEILLGKFLGILATIAGAFLVMILVSLFTVWWTEAYVEKPRANPTLALVEAPAVATGQGSLQTARSYEKLMTRREGQGLECLESAGDVLLLLTGQSSALAARVPLSARPPDRPWPPPTAASPGLAALVNDLLGFFPRTGLLFQAFLLAFVQVMVLAAVAVAVSTRLPLVFNALVCSAVFVLGSIARPLGEMMLASDSGGVLQKLVAWPVALLCLLLPKFDNLDLTEAVAVGMSRAPPAAWIYGTLYGIVYTIIILGLAALLFRRREVA